MAKLVRHWSGEDIYGKALTRQEVLTVLGRLDPISVLLFSSFTSVLLGFWKRSFLNFFVYKGLIERLYSRSVSARIMAGWGDRYVFCRRQLLILSRFALENYSPDSTGLKVENPQLWEDLGRVLLGINDLLHFGLTGRDDLPRQDRIRNLFVELTPVVEDGGVSVFAKITRSNLMLVEIPQQLLGSHTYMNMQQEFEGQTQLSLRNFQAVCIALLSKWTSKSINELLVNQDDLFLKRQWFQTAAIDPVQIDKALEALSGTAVQLRADFTGRLLEDFTPFKAKPLLKLNDQYLIMDLGYVAESLDAYPFWTLSKQHVGSKLRIFWGEIFERYTTQMTQAVSRPAVNRIIADPRFVTGSKEQVCDFMCLYCDMVVLVETKGVMFAGNKKYSGNVDEFFRDFKLRFVQNKEGKKKGVSQLASAIQRIFVRGERVEGIDLSQVRNVYSLIVSLDQLADNPLMNAALNLYFDYQALSEQSHLNVMPALGISAESYELLSAHAGSIPIPVLLNDWLTADPTLRTSYPMLNTEITNLLGDKKIRTFVDTT
jgi:hypothetical protein